MSRKAIAGRRGSVLDLCRQDHIRNQAPTVVAAGCQGVFPRFFACCQRAGSRASRETFGLAALALMRGLRGASNY